MELDDSDIIKKYLNGDAQSFELIVDRYTQPIFNFIFRLCGNVDESNDLTQEVFLKVWKNLKSFDPEKKFKTWLFSIARNTVIDWFRKRKHIAFSVMNLMNSGQDGQSNSFEENLPDLEPLPDEIFMKKELASDLERALAKINPDDKTIIILYHADDLTFEEIAEIVGRPMNSVKSQYRRALNLLRSYLSEQ